MPDPAVVDYYEAVGSKILPLLRGRRVAVRHRFGRQSVMRRHLPNGRWIYLKNQRALREIVRQHGYEFFPHLEGDRDVWFALDIDCRAVPLRLCVVVVQTALKVLEERGVRYLLTFSGANGFHVRWAFPRADLPLRKWRFLRSIVAQVRDLVEERLQASRYRDKFYRYIPHGDPVTELNAVDAKAQSSVLFDALILKRQGTIRSPFSLHMRRRWVAVPIDPRGLKDFRPALDATMAAARSHRAIRIPRNRVRLFLRAPWSAGVH